ncbi:MAG: hypothetical protein ACE5FL_11845 [Myxococcota bacterium]
MTAYRVLCGVLAALMILLGGALFMTFFGYHTPNSSASFQTGPTGHYFIAFTGCALFGWAGGLVAATRRPESGHTVGTATAFALVLSAVYRMVAWIVGDYHALGELPRVEAALFLLLALAFVWLRPPPLTGHAEVAR